MLMEGGQVSLQVSVESFAPWRSMFAGGPIVGRLSASNPISEAHLCCATIA